MAKAKKPTRKELLKEPDEFLTLSRRMIQFAFAHKTPILAGIGGFFALLLAVAVYQYLSIRAEDRAFSLLQEATAAYQEAAASGAPEQARASTAEMFETLLDRHAGRTAAKIGRVVYADICYRGGDPQTAAMLYQQALTDFTGDPALESLIAAGLGHAFEAAGDREKAVAYFRKVLENGGALMGDDARFQLARLYTRMGRLDEATALYREISEAKPDSLYGRIAGEKAARAGG